MTSAPHASLSPAGVHEELLSEQIIDNPLDSRHTHAQLFGNGSARGRGVQPDEFKDCGAIDQSHLVGVYRSRDHAQRPRSIRHMEVEKHLLTFCK
jgi:hypothetical protein